MTESVIGCAADEPKTDDEARLPHEARVASPELSNDQLEKCIGGLGDIRHLLLDFPV